MHPWFKYPKIKYSSLNIYATADHVFYVRSEIAATIVRPSSEFQHRECQLLNQYESSSSNNNIPIVSHECFPTEYRIQGFVPILVQNIKPEFKTKTQNDQTSLSSTHLHSTTYHFRFDHTYPNIREFCPVAVQLQDGIISETYRKYMNIIQ